MTTSRPTLAARLRTTALAAVLAATSFIVTAAPGSRPSADTGSSPFEGIIQIADDLFAPKTALAAYCASNPTFTGYLTASTSSHPQAARITDPDLYAWISNVDSTWSCTAYYRFSGVAWNTTASAGRFDWGLLITSTSVACNYVVGSNDYVKGNPTTDCPDTDAEYALGLTLTAQRVYQQDVDHDSVGDLSFVHSDCSTAYGGGDGEAVSGTEAAPENFNAGNVDNRPGANCDPLTIDAFGASPAQTITYDATPPALAVSAPAAGGPVLVPSAFYVVAFSASDALAGLNAAGWSLQRQKAAWSGTACGTYANDGSPVTGTATGAQQSGQSLALNACYRWVLSATDLNGNAGSTTSGSIRTDTSGVLGLQGHLRTESFDLGAGDSLAVSVGSGNAIISHPVVSLPVRGSSVDIALTYNSHDAGNVGFGPGWRLNVQRRLALNADGTVTFTDGDGSRHTFTNPVVNGTVTTYTRPATLYATLVKDTALTANEFVLTYRDQSRDKFDIAGSEGLLTRAEDRFANGVTLAYVAGTSRIATITDTAASRTIDFAYDVSNPNLLTSITDWAYVDNGIVQTSATGARRVNRFFYAGSNLAGWADPLNTSGSCPTGGSHLTCLTLTNGLVTRIGKTQTYTTLNAGALGTATRAVNTDIAYSGADVTSVKDAEQVAASATGTLFSHLNAGQTQIVRQGTPASTTRYTLASPTDAYGRVTSVKRLLGASTWIEQRTAYDATYPVEAASVTENYVDGTPSDAAPDEDRVTAYTYVANSMGLVSRLTEPLTASTHRTTDYTWNANNDITQTITALDGSGTVRTVSRSCYDATCTLWGSGLVLLKTISNFVDGTAGDANGNVEDVTTTYEYDTACAAGSTCGQRTLERRYNYTAAGGAPIDTAATGWTYDTLGNQTAEIRNWINGAVTSPGDDITPDATGARTDLTTVFGYDTAGNRVSTADPRRAAEAARGTSLAPDDFVSRATFDPLGRQLTETTPTTPGVSITQKTATSAYDELGGLREAVDFGGVVTATESDRTGRATRTFEDVDGAGATAAAVTSITSFDAAGRVLIAKDRRQAADASLGATVSTYDELGQTLTVTEAWTNPITPLATFTATSYDDLGRIAAETVGGLQTTTYAYDLGGRTLRTDDEFACTTRTYDWQDRETGVTEGLSAGACTGTGTVTTTTTLDLFGRPTGRTISVTGGTSETQISTYTSSGPSEAASTIGGTTVTSTFTVNPLDEVIAEVRSDGSTTKTTYDPAGNPTDVCYWKPGTTVGDCLPADTAAGSWPNPPTQAHTAAYDARNGRITLITRLGTGSMVSTTTYDPDHAYQVDAVYLPTAGGREVQDLYAYDARHRVTGITHQLCVLSSGHACSSTTPMGSSAYAYDANSNRTSVTESSTGGAATSRTYCYDALDRLTASRATSSCATSPDETYSYDDAGNRLTAMTGGSTRSFFHDGDTGQLETCTGPSCSVSYDGAGRTSTLTDNGTSWTFAYDGEGRVASACAGTTCTGSGFNRIDYRYDATGRRVAITTTPAGGTATTTDLRYAGSAIAQESVAGTVTRTYAADETGRIVLVCDPDCDTGTRYLVTWNGHGDATGLWRRNADGTLTLANSYTYSTWGTPTTTTHNGIADLGFRFLYVGSGDVQWDNAFGLGLYYMHARHYSPRLGRFLQPDPSAADANLYGYAENNAVSADDSDGLKPGPWIYLRSRKVPVVNGNTKFVVWAMTIWACRAFRVVPGVWQACIAVGVMNTKISGNLDYWMIQTAYNPRTGEVILTKTRYNLTPYASYRWAGYERYILDGGGRACALGISGWGNPYAVQLCGPAKRI